MGLSGDEMQGEEEDAQLFLSIFHQGLLFDLFP